VVGIENLSRLGLDFVKKDLDLPEIKVYTKAVPVELSLLTKAVKK